MSPTIALIVLCLVLLFLIVLSISVVISIFLRVPYVPTPQRIVHKMIALADPKDTDVVLDLGCGDGRLVHEVATSTKATCRGYELSVLPYLLACLHGFFRGSHAQIVFKDFFGASFADATIIFTYLTPGVMKRLEEKLQAEVRTTPVRVISHGFGFPTIEADEVTRVTPERGLPYHIYSYTII